MDQTNHEPKDRAPEPLEVGDAATTDDLSKDELQLLEYPISLIAERAPKRKKCPQCGATYANRKALKECPACSVPLALVDLKTIEWTSWTTIDGQRVPQRWLVTGSDQHGLPTGPDNDILVALIESARRAGFKDKHISLRNAYTLLKSVMHTGGTQYERFIRAIPRWATLSFHTEYTLRDPKNREHLERKRGFTLFQEYDVISKEQRTKDTTPTGKRDPIVFGYVTMSDRFYEMLRLGPLKDLDLRFYRALPNPVAKKLYRYLDKKRWYGGYFAIDAKKLLAKLGFEPTAITSYPPNKVRNLLSAALDDLVARGFLTRYDFRKTPTGQKLSVYFAEPGTGPDHPTNPFGLTDEQTAYAQVLAQDIAEVCGSADRNAGFYFKTAAEAVKESRVELVRRALSETRAADVPLGTVQNRSAYFTETYKALRAQLTLPFNKVTS